MANAYLVAPAQMVMIPAIAFVVTDPVFSTIRSVPSYIIAFTLYAVDGVSRLNCLVMDDVVDVPDSVVVSNSVHADAFDCL